MFPQYYDSVGMKFGKMAAEPHQVTMESAAREEELLAKEWKKRTNKRKVGGIHVLLG